MSAPIHIKVTGLGGQTLKGMAAMIHARAKYLKQAHHEAAVAVIIEAAKGIQRATREAKAK